MAFARPGMHHLTAAGAEGTLDLHVFALAAFLEQPGVVDAAACSSRFAPT
jgi:hypothetical protein